MILSGYATVAGTGTSQSGLIARASGTTYYFATLSAVNAVNTAKIFKCIDGACTAIASAASVSAANLRFEVLGNSLKLYTNGTLKLSVTDASIQSPGLSGVRGYGVFRLDNFGFYQP